MDVFNKSSCKCKKKKQKTKLGTFHRYYLNCTCFSSQKTQCTTTAQFQHPLLLQLPLHILQQITVALKEIMLVLHAAVQAVSVNAIRNVFYNKKATLINHSQLLPITLYGLLRNQSLPNYTLFYCVALSHQSGTHWKHSALAQCDTLNFSV